MEKSIKIGMGLFFFILAAGLIFTQGKGMTGNIVLSDANGGPENVVEIKTTLQGFQYNPDTINIKDGSQVKLVIDNKDNVNHGIHLPQFGVVDGIPPNGIKTLQFKAVKGQTNGQTLPTCSQEHGEVLTINVI